MNIHTKDDASGYTDDDIYNLVPNIYFRRRQGIMGCSWDVTYGFEMGSLSHHQFFSIQLCKLLGQIKLWPKPKIAMACYTVIDHDSEEPLTGDKNPYSALYITIDKPAAMHAIESGLVTEKQNMQDFHDYELAKEGKHPDPFINDCGMLAKDAEVLERRVSLIEGLAREQFPQRLWDHEETQRENLDAYNSYHFDETRQLHDAILKYGVAAYDDAFLRLPNIIKQRRAARQST